jgi:hypothetical protein
LDFNFAIQNFFCKRNAFILKQGTKRLAPVHNAFKRHWMSRIELIGSRSNLEFYIQLIYSMGLIQTAFSI